MNSLSVFNYRVLADSEEAAKCPLSGGRRRITDDAAGENGRNSRSGEEGGSNAEKERKCRMVPSIHEVHALQLTVQGCTEIGKKA